METIKPFFVYGTLMEGFRNHEMLVVGKDSKIIQGRLDNYYLRHFKAGHPGMYQANDEKGKIKSVVGEIIFPKPECYKLLSDDFDKLEAYYGPNNPNNMYERKEVLVRDDTGKTFVCDTYICLLDESKGVLFDVDVFDWRLFMKNKGLEDAG